MDQQGAGERRGGGDEGFFRYRWRPPREGENCSPSDPGFFPNTSEVACAPAPTHALVPAALVYTGDREGRAARSSRTRPRARGGRGSIFFIHSTKSLATHQWARQGDTWRGALDAGGTPHALAARPPCSLNFLGARLRADRQSSIGRNNYSTDLWAPCKCIPPVIVTDGFRRPGRGNPMPVDPEHSTQRKRGLAVAAAGTGPVSLPFLHKKLGQRSKG